MRLVSQTAMDGANHANRNCRSSNSMAWNFQSGVCRCVCVGVCVCVGGVKVTEVAAGEVKTGPDGVSGERRRGGRGRSFNCEFDSLTNWVGESCLVHKAPVHCHFHL